MPTIVSRIERRVPAARIAANDEPYSITRCSPRCHQTRCGMWCTSGWAPVAIDVRHTGVREGNVVTPRRYSPAAASAESVGAERSPTAFSNVDGVNPSITMRIVLLGKGAEAGVLFSRAPARARREDGQRSRLEVADRGDERECERGDRSERQQQRGASRRAAPAQRSLRERSRADAGKE